jgi:hypothetical protein
MTDDTLSLLEELASLLKVARDSAEAEELEELLKSCPRCGAASANSSNPSGRCRKHLNKLAKDKKTSGHWQRAQTKADDALRRQDGKNGTASKKSKGRGSRKEIVNKMKAAEKKTGQKLSPDRVDNSSGYASSNVRAVPEKLNRGRHHVDKKKLNAWKKRLKKMATTDEEFYTYVLSKANEKDLSEELTEILQEMSPTKSNAFLDKLDVE